MSPLSTVPVASAAAVILVAALGLTVPIKAQDKATATVGQEAKLVSSKQSLKVTTEPKSGSFRVMEDAGTFTLFYTPKPDIKERTTDSLQYQVGSDPKIATVTVAIEPNPAAAGQKPGSTQASQAPTGSSQQPASDPGTAAGFPPNTYDQSLKAIFVLFAELSPRTFWNFAREFSSSQSARAERRLRTALISDTVLAPLFGRPRAPLVLAGASRRKGPRVPVVGYR